MGRTLPAFRSGLAVAAAVVLLAACGGSDDKSAGSSTSASRSSTAQSSAPAGDTEFCTRAAAALQDVAPAFSGGDDPSALATALQHAADQVRTIHPPAAIADEWKALADGIEQFAKAFAGVNPKDPAAAASLEKRSSEIIGGLTAAATKVQTYLATTCGIAVPTDSAASTS
jgi:hypothetical protein